jgi:hypothetical protein
MVFTTTSEPPDRSAVPRRELVLVSVALVALSRLADGPAVWAIALLVPVIVFVGGLQVMADPDAPPERIGVPIESLIIPAVAGYASLGVIRLVPIGLGLIPAVAAAALLLDRTLRTEARIAGVRRAEGEGGRTRVLGEALIVGFLAFLGSAALVPGGLPEPGTVDGAGGDGLSEANLLLLAGVDALVAALLGYRATALRTSTARAALWSAATYASAVAIAAAALRATEIPRLVGPALLTLVFFLWDAFHGAEPARRRDPRWVWQTALLVALGAVVVVWNLGLR